jgi:hypothetical protein
MSLVLRKRTDGTMSVVGDAPDEHTFATSFVQRGLEDGTVRVRLTVETADGPLEYDLAAIGDPDGTPNATSWQCAKVEQAKPKRKGR